MSAMKMRQLTGATLAALFTLAMLVTVLGFLALSDQVEPYLRVLAAIGSVILTFLILMLLFDFPVRQRVPTAGEDEAANTSPLRPSGSSSQYFILLVVAVTALVFGTATFATTSMTGLTGAEVAAFITAGTAVVTCVVTAINTIMTNRATKRATILGKDAPSPTTAAECFALAYAEFAVDAKFVKLIPRQVNDIEASLWDWGVAGVELHLFPAQRRELLQLLLMQSMDSWLPPPHSAGGLRRYLDASARRDRAIDHACAAYVTHLKRAFERLVVQPDQPVQAVPLVVYCSYYLAGPVRSLEPPLDDEENSYRMSTLDLHRDTVSRVWHSSRTPWESRSRFISPHLSNRANREFSEARRQKKSTMGGARSMASKREKPGQTFET